MRLRNMLRICLVFWKSEPRCAYKRYAYKKNMYMINTLTSIISLKPAYIFGLKILSQSPLLSSDG